MNLRNTCSTLAEGERKLAHRINSQSQTIVVIEEPVGLCKQSIFRHTVSADRLSKQSENEFQLVPEHWRSALAEN